jgi:hypothetical protein
MTRTFIFLLLFLSGYATNAQSVLLQNGKLMTGDSVYCLYETDDYDYPSYVFSTRNTEQLVFADALDLSTAEELYMVHYYRVSFPLLGEEFYIRYQSNRIQYLAEDLVKYGVFADDRWNPDAAHKLVAAWRKKVDNLSPKKIAGGTSVFSNPAANTPPHDSLLAGISFRENNIYRGDTVIGKYEVDEQPVRGGAFNRGHVYYYFMDLKGNRLAQVIAPQLRSVAYMKIGDEERSLQLLCPDKSPEKLLRVATGVLLMKGLL